MSDYRVELLDGVEAALTYDYLQHRGPHDRSTVGIVRGYLETRFQERILIRRHAVQRLLDFLAAGEPTVLIGAPGGGKTAALLALNHELRNRRAAGQATHTLVAFNGNKNASRLLNRPTLDEKTNYISERIAGAIGKHFQRAQSQVTQDDWNYKLYTSADQFQAFRSVYNLSSSQELASILQQNQIAQAEWLRQYNAFLGTKPIDRLQRMVELLSEEGIHLAIAIDNCDQLSNLDLEAAKRATSDLHGVTKNNIPVIVAVRPTTLGRATRHMSFAPFKTVFLNAFEDIPSQRTIHEPFDLEDLKRDLSQAYEIFDTRLRSFDDPLLQAEIAASLVERGHVAEGTRRSIRSELARLRLTAKRVLEDYFTFNGNEADVDEEGENEHDGDEKPASSFSTYIEAAGDDLTVAFVKWHNGSLREIATSLFAFTLRYADERIAREMLRTADIPQSLGDEMFQPAHVRNSRTALFRHLIFQGTSRDQVDEGGFPKMHESLRIFEPRVGSNEHIFSFPKARVLQYLFRRRAAAVSVRFSDIIEEFSLFNLRKPELSEAVLSLSARPGYESGLLRIDGREDDAFADVARYNQQVVEEDSALELLPAGEFLISRLCYVVEYVYWSAVTDPQAREDVARHLGLTSPELLLDRSYFNRAARRVDVALSYLADVMLPRFQREHPYMQIGREPRSEEVDRLHEFCRLFGFGPGDWHFSRALRQIQAYLRGRAGRGTPERPAAVPLSEAAQSRMEAIENVCLQLDHVFAGRS